MRIQIKSLGQPHSSNVQIGSFFELQTCLACLLLLFTSGCRLFEMDSDSIRSSIDSREIAPKAVYHNSKGLKYLSHGHTGKAETHFLKAIDYDPTFAAAHNNLGNMLFSRRDLYQAAWEFQRATQLEPNSIEPLVNLGLVHDEADRLEEAAEFYQQALQINPKSPVALSNLVRVRIKQDHDPIEIHSILRELVLIDNRPDWVDWAQELLATRFRPDYGTGSANSNMPSNQSYINQEPPGLRFPNAYPSPNQSELIQPTNPPKSAASVEESLPSPVYSTPNPAPTLMDIPANANGVWSYPVNETQEIQLQSYLAVPTAIPAGTFNGTILQNGPRR